MGLSLVSAAGAAAQSAVNKTAAGAARGGRNAELQSKGRHSDNAFRLDPGHCHHLSNPDVLIAYNKWATNQSTGKKALYWAFYDELEVAVGKYPPICRCAGCHPVVSATLALYEQKKVLKAMSRGLSDTISFILHAPMHYFGMWCDFCMYVRTHTRTHARMHACMNTHAYTRACMYGGGRNFRHTQTLTFFFMCRSSGSAR